MKKIVCPYCGYASDPSGFDYMYETVLYIADHKVLPEERNRPVLVICPRCRKGFFLESPYKKIIKEM